MINPFMSKEQKALRTKLVIRKGISDLKRYERSLEKAKTNMINLGRKAKEQGSQDQVRLLVGGVKSIMAQQLRAGKMQIQLTLMENMHQLSAVSSQFSNLLGNVGREISKIAGSTNLLANSEKMQTGMLNMETMMDQMDDFMTDFDSSMSDTKADQISDNEIEKLFNLPATQEESSTVSELEKKLQDEMSK